MMNKFSVILFLTILISINSFSQIQIGDDIDGAQAMMDDWE